MMSVTRFTAATTSCIVAPAWSASLEPVSTLSTEASISTLISLAAAAERCARLRTSDATTAKPRPCSPARAASTAAFSARMLVWNAMPSITLMMSAIFFGAGADQRHRLHHFVHRLPALDGDIRGAGRQLVGLPGVLGVLLHRRGQFFHAACGLFQAGGLLFGALRQVAVARRDLPRRGADRCRCVLRTSPTMPARLAFMSCSACSNCPNSSPGFHLDALAQVAPGDRVGEFQCLQQGAGDRAGVGPSDEHAQHQHHHRHRDRQRTGAANRPDGLLRRFPRYLFAGRRSFRTGLPAAFRYWAAIHAAEPGSLPVFCCP